MHEEGRDIGLEEGQDVGEYIFSLTGWAYDNAGNLVVDHEFASHDTASRQAWAQDKWAHIVDAENRDLRSENEGLREDVQKWKRRTAAAEEAARTMARFIRSE